MCLQGPHSYVLRSALLTTLLFASRSASIKAFPYASAWLKFHYLGAFTAAILNIGQWAFTPPLCWSKTRNVTVSVCGPST